MLQFRNINARPEDPVSTWGFEGVLTAIERGNITHWQRLATEVHKQPYGQVAQWVEMAITTPVDEDAPLGRSSRQMLSRILARARDPKLEVAQKLRFAVARSGISQAAFARALGTSASRFSTYLSGQVMPSAELMLRAESLSFGHQD